MRSNGRTKWTSQGKLQASEALRNPCGYRYDVALHQYANPFQFPDSLPPIIKHWRCDLTALSHVYNLYFVACNEDIYIFSPSFPSQDLGEAVRILQVPSLGLPTPPGIDTSDPHSVTRICVDYLGNTEVLLITCDDGDVVGCRVGEIVSLTEHCSTLRVQSRW